MSFYFDNPENKRRGEIEEASDYSKIQVEYFDKNVLPFLSQNNIKVTTISGKNITNDFIRAVNGLYQSVRKFRKIEDDIWANTRSEEKRRKDAWDQLEKACNENEAVKDLWDQLCMMGKLYHDSKDNE